MNTDAMGELDSRCSAPIRLLVVQDHRLNAEGLVALLNDSPTVEVVRWAATVNDAIIMTDTLQPHVLLMDSLLPDGTGAEAARKIHYRHPEIAIVFLSSDGRYDAIVGAIEAGARGYLSKGLAATDLEAAIRGAAAGDIVLSAEVLATLVSHRQERRHRPVKPARRISQLTSREREVLGLLADGLGNREISSRLGITYTTVRFHVQRLLEKTGAHSRLQAVVRAVEVGLLPPPVRSGPPLSSLN